MGRLQKLVHALSGLAMVGLIGLSINGFAVGALDTGPQHTVVWAGTPLPA